MGYYTIRLDPDVTKICTIIFPWGLTVNARKSSFCAAETEYLGYVLSRDGIKLQPKKVQAIFPLTQPQNVKQLHRFLDMVQCYRDIWARHSEILAPLTNLVGECGLTKVKKANKTKKKPWHWDSVQQPAFDTVNTTIACDVNLAYPMIQIAQNFNWAL
eukprot:CCRYP_017395-RA/>CCRYP_017395-RA protein AED:0.33 eAED:0.38 QI:0/0/0/1/0/0/2/0/157